MKLQTHIYIFFLSLFFIVEYSVGRYSMTTLKTILLVIDIAVFSCSLSYSFLINIHYSFLSRWNGRIHHPYTQAKLYLVCAKQLGLYRVSFSFFVLFCSTVKCERFCETCFLFWPYRSHALPAVFIIHIQCSCTRRYTWKASVLLCLWKLLAVSSSTSFWKECNSLHAYIFVKIWDISFPLKNQN
jgi:hypothetical protein